MSTGSTAVCFFQVGSSMSVTLVFAQRLPHAEFSVRGLFSAATHAGVTESLWRGRQFELPPDEPSV